MSIKIVIIAEPININETLKVLRNLNKKNTKIQKCIFFNKVSKISFLKRLFYRKLNTITFTQLWSFHKLISISKYSKNITKIRRK